ncbi:hypothetical protein DRB96_02005 [Streptomyces sp. ICC1]|nr:hypothetical protein DRB89_00875 [Streptomyces sp. ICC4]AWZ17674.1 hypothetical protein DRB96_02005 [Streptomyces sp. ICC1]
MTRVLVVDDEPQLVRSLVIHLKARKYDVESARDGGQASQVAAVRRPDVVLLDLGPPGPARQPPRHGVPLRGVSEAEPQGPGVGRPDRASDREMGRPL